MALALRRVMARRYVRDNRGRFATVGATARGGRLATASGNKRATQTTELSGGKASGTIGKPKGLKPGAIKAKPQASSARQRGDTASVNIPMSGARGRALDRDISRNVAQQRKQERAADKARNRQVKSEQSRAKALRTAHVGSIAKAKGLTKGQVESALKAQSPSVQIKALKNWVRDNRKTAGAANPVSTARQAATDRLKVKTQTRRAMSADRSSVVTPGQRSRLEAGRGSTRAGARPASTVAKPRTTGNTKQQVASRVERKLAATNANLSDMTRYGSGANPTAYSRQLKRSVTLERAQSYLTTGKLPGKDNSIAAQRSMRQAKERLAAKNAARAAASKPARSRSAVGRIDGAKADRIIQRHDAMRPGLRPGTGSKARSMNSINTFLRARKFLLEPSRKVAKKGETISGQESIRRAVAGASKKARKRK